MICAEDDYEHVKIQVNVHGVPFPERPETVLSASAEIGDDGCLKSEAACIIADVGVLTSRIYKVGSLRSMSSWYQLLSTNGMQDCPSIHPIT